MATRQNQDQDAMRPARSGPSMPFLLILALLSIVLFLFLYFEMKRNAWGYDYEQTFQALIRSDETEFAPGFSEAAFKQVAFGDSMEHVEELLGEPLDRTPPVGLNPILDRVKIGTWYYSRSSGGNVHHIRTIFFTNNRVHEITSAVQFTK